MLMMVSQILKSLDFPKTQKLRYLENKTLFFLQIIKFVNYTSRATLWQKLVLQWKLPIKIPSTYNFTSHKVLLKSQDHYTSFTTFGALRQLRKTGCKYIEYEFSNKNDSSILQLRKKIEFFAL